MGGNSSFQIFHNFFMHIDNHLINYASQTSQSVATMVGPGAMGSFAIYLLFHAYQQMAGNTEQPFMEFLHSAFKNSMILGTALGMGDYNQVVIQTFQNSPAALAAAMGDPTQSGGTLNDIGTFLDNLLTNVFSVFHTFWTMGSMLSVSGLGEKVFGIVLLGICLILIVIIAALIVLSKVATGLGLAMGPIFIMSLMHKATQNFFNNWINTIIQYGMISVLAVGTNAVLLSMVNQTATDAVAKGGSLQIADVMGLLATTGASILLLTQVPSLASGFAGGMSLNTSGAARSAGGAAGFINKKALGGQSRENKRAAANQLEVAKYRQAFEAKSANKESKGGEISRTTRKGPRVDTSRKTGTFDE
ncbi:MAG: TrbL/VirB6 family protein [Burkholderiales bacterium]